MAITILHKLPNEVTGVETQTYESLSTKFSRLSKKYINFGKKRYKDGSLASYIYVILLFINLIFYEWRGYNVILLFFIGVAAVLYLHPYWKHPPYWQISLCVLCIAVTLDAYLSILILQHIVDYFAIVTLLLDTVILTLVAWWQLAT